MSAGSSGVITASIEATRRRRLKENGALTEHPTRVSEMAVAASQGVSYMDSVTAAIASQGVSYRVSVTAITASQGVRRNITVSPRSQPTQSQ